MKRLKHMDFYEKLLEAPRNELVEKAIEQGRMPIGYHCLIVPEPLLSMDKAFPLKLRANNIHSTEIADFYMSPTICSYARSLVESVLDGNYNFLKGNIGTSSCIHINRTAEYFEILDTHKHEENYFTSIIDVPRKKGFEPWIQVLARQFREKVGNKLRDNYGMDVSDESLRKAIKFQNKFNQMMSQISDLRKLDCPKITGTEFHTIFAASKVAPRDMLIGKLQETLDELKARDGIEDYRARLMVVGSLMDDIEFTKLIEDQGVLVVADRYCSGSLPGMEPIPEDGDPYYNLAKHYLEMTKCPRTLNNDEERRDYALHLVKEFKVDGILFEIVKFCEMWGYENLTFVPDMKDANIPIVGIERDYNLSSAGQIRTRVQAFVESIEIKKINRKSQ